MYNSVITITQGTQNHEIDSIIQFFWKLSEKLDENNAFLNYLVRKKNCLADLRKLALGIIIKRGRGKLIKIGRHRLNIWCTYCQRQVFCQLFWLFYSLFNRKPDTNDTPFKSINV